MRDKEFDNIGHENEPTSRQSQGTRGRMKIHLFLTEMDELQKNQQGRCSKLEQGLRT